MSSYIKKPEVCNRCFLFVSWDEPKRTAMGTKRPLVPDNTVIHDCPKNAAGEIMINLENKALYDQWEAQKNAKIAATGANPAIVAGLTPPSPPYKDAPPPYSQQTLTTGNNDVGIILGTMQNRLNEMAQMETQYKDILLRMETTIDTQKQIIKEYVEYDPVGTQLNRLINTLLKYLPPPALEPQRADELLEEEGERK